MHLSWMFGEHGHLNLDGLTLVKTVKRIVPDWMQACLDEAPPHAVSLQPEMRTICYQLILFFVSFQIKFYTDKKTKLWNLKPYTNVFCRQLNISLFPVNRILYRQTIT